MKLESKHLTPYLPYGLKLYYIGGNNNNATIELEPSHFRKDWSIEIFSKPILRPLSDLTKEINSFIGLTHYEFLEETYENHSQDISHLKRIESEDERWMYSIPLYLYEYLLENHFDVFGLIEKGLAIDINTL